MASGAAVPAVEDTGLDALILLLRFHEIAVDPAQIRHQHGAAAFGIPDIVRCARQFRLKARAVSTSWDRLAKTSLPALAQCRDGNFDPPPPGGKEQTAPRDTIFDQPAPAGAAKKTSEVLGEIVWLMSQSPLHKQLFISDTEWLVMTPMLLQQFRLFYDKAKPVGVIFWASVSEEVEARLAAGTTRMRPQDWKSGDRLWVVEAIAPFGAAEEMVKDLKAKVFPGREIKLLAVGPKGREVKTI
jgi:cytolysin-activating lysine-acyltransferase